MPKDVVRVPEINEVTGQLKRMPQHVVSLELERSSKSEWQRGAKGGKGGQRHTAEHPDIVFSLLSVS